LQAETKELLFALVECHLLTQRRNQACRVLVETCLLPGPSQPTCGQLSLDEGMEPMGRVEAAWAALRGSLVGRNFRAHFRVEGGNSFVFV